MRKFSEITILKVFKVCKKWEKFWAGNRRVLWNKRMISWNNWNQRWLRGIHKNTRMIFRQSLIRNRRINWCRCSKTSRTNLRSDWSRYNHKCLDKLIRCRIRYKWKLNKNKGSWINKANMRPTFNSCNGMNRINNSPRTLKKQCSTVWRKS